MKMFPLCCAVIKMLFHKHHCSIDWKYCRHSNSETFLQEWKMYFLNAVCLEWFEEGEWPISFPIMKNQSAPDRCDFIQSGFMWNDFWWPLSSRLIHAKMLLHQQGLDHYQPPATPSWPGLISCTLPVPDWRFQKTHTADTHCHLMKYNQISGS